MCEMDKEQLDLIKNLQPLFRKKGWKTGDRAYHPECGIGIYHSNERVYFNGFSLSGDNKKLLHYPREGELWKMIDWSKLKPAEIQIDINGHVSSGDGKWEELELVLLKALKRQEQEQEQEQNK